MKTILSILIFFGIKVLSPLELDAQYLNFRFGEFTDPEISDNIEFDESGLYISYSDHDSSSVLQLNISKYDYSGSFIWRKTVNFNSIIAFNYFTENAITKCQNGSYIGGALLTDQNDETINYAAIIKYNSEFDTLWTAVFGDGIDSYAGTQAVETIDGGFVLVGQTIEDGIDSQVLIIKTDEFGNQEWIKKHGFTSGYFDIGRSIVQTADTGYILSGYTRELFNSPTNHLLMKLDSDGELLDTQVFGDWEFYDGAPRMLKTTDGNFIYGATIGITENEEQVYFAKFDEYLNIIWDSSVELENHIIVVPKEVKESVDGGFVSVGYAVNNDDLNIEGFLVKVDENGNYLWTRYYRYLFEEGISSNFLFDVIPLPDGSYAMCGMRNYPDEYFQDNWVLIVDENGCMDFDCSNSIPNLLINSSEIKIGPNPFTNRLTFQFQEGFDYNQLDINIHNLSGGLVYHETIVPQFSNSIQIDGLESGEYVLSISSEGKLIHSVLIMKNE